MKKLCGQFENPLPVGHEFRLEVVFDELSIRQFAKLSGDFNPVHHDVEFATKSRFRSLIASGSQISSVILGFVASYVSERVPSVGLGLEVRFRKAIHVGEHSIVIARVESIESKATLGGDYMVIKADLINSKGEVAVSATAPCLIFKER